MEFVTLTNDVSELSGVVILTSADVTLDTVGRDCSLKAWVLSVLLNNFGRQIRPCFYTDFVTLTNDVPVPSAVVNLTSADVALDIMQMD